MPGRNQQGDYRYAYQGQEKDPETGWEALELRMYDGRVGRWMTTDPYSQYHSPYLAMGNNPISRIDPDGGHTSDWYINNETGEYQWFYGSEAREGYEHVGEYKVGLDGDNLTIRWQLLPSETINLNSDEGARLRMMIAEGGFNRTQAYKIDKTGRGVNVSGGGHRETYYGLLIIAATMDNRIAAINNPNNADLELSGYWGSGDSYESLFLRSEFNGVVEEAYTDFNTWFNTSAPNAGRTRKDIYSLIGDAHLATKAPIAKLVFRGMSLENASSILAYAHNNAGAQLYNNRSIPLNRNLTLIQFINGRTDVSTE